MFKESVEFNLQQILPSCTDGGKSVTGSAFSQARYKIKSDYFKDIVDQLKTGYDLSNKRLWKGHLLVAGDGSTLNLPPSKEIADHFGAYATTNDGTNTYLARVLFLYDVLNDFSDDSIFLLDKGIWTLLYHQRIFCQEKRLLRSSSFQLKFC